MYIFFKYYEKNENYVVKYLDEVSKVVMEVFFCVQTW